MKRDEKNLISRRKILDSAILEFAAKGYGLSSINTICTTGEISKGILYHYFKEKDELYLVCIQELFDALTQHLTDALADQRGTPEDRLERYFEARQGFFQAHPLHHKLFCDVAISAPQHLAPAIGEIKGEFNALNISVLTKLLQELKLREDLTVESAVETFRIFQDFANARYRMEPWQPLDLEQHEQACKRSLDILLYGVVAGRGCSHEQ